MNEQIKKILFTTISIVFMFIANPPNASAYLLPDYSTTSAGGNLSPVTFVTSHWRSDVHFAVYSPGDQAIAGESGYQDFAPSPIQVTSEDYTNSIVISGTDYTYVYQISHDPAAIANLTGLNIGISSHALETITSVGYTNDPDINIFSLGSGDPGDGPLVASFSTGSLSVQYPFTFNEIEAGDESFTLFFTSTSPPTFNSATLSNAGEADTHQMPSPVGPEPISSILFITGGVVLASKRYLKKYLAVTLSYK